MPELYLVRHAQASFGAEDYDNLSELGHQQSRWLGEHFARLGVTFDHHVVGDMRRHRQTHAGILAGMGAGADGNQAVPHENDGLNEYDFRALTEAFARQFPEDELLQQYRAGGASKHDHFRLLRRALAEWQQDTLGSDIPETWEDFKARVAAAQRSIQSLAGAGERVLVVSSGGPISVLTGLVLEVPDSNIFDLNLQIKNTSVAQFFFNDRKMSFAGFNSTPHFEHPDRLHAITYG